MTSIRFGFCVPVFASPGRSLFRTPGFADPDAGRMMGIARRADGPGYDSLWVADHLMPGGDEAIFEGRTVLSAPAGATGRAKLGMIHQAPLFRNPVLAAKMSATLDHLSGGRLIHFPDCGFTPREFVGYGLPRDGDVETRVARLAEATELTLGLWTATGPVTRDGRFHRVEDAVRAPRPVRRPSPPLWFGEVRPGVFDLCAKHGHGWNTTPVSIPGLRSRLALVHHRAGRPLGDLELSPETQILIAPDTAALRSKLSEFLDPARSEGPAGPPPGAAAAAADFTAFMDGATDAVPRRPGSGRKTAPRLRGRRHRPLPAPVHGRARPGGPRTLRARRHPTLPLTWAPSAGRGGGDLKPTPPPHFSAARQPIAAVPEEK
ncbi:MAG: LLM class flavin-dependent oxidoreductase, partial [Thermomicrobiales bacterium]